MFQSLDLFQTAGAMAKHAGARQAVVAQNVAHADTPGYRAQNIAPFQDVFERSTSFNMRGAREGHIASATGASRLQIELSSSEPAPNGNSVSIEEEMQNAVAISREHSRALAIYQHTLTVLRTTIGR